VSASILIGIIFLNIQWINDYNAILENFGNHSQLSPYIVESKVVNPEIILILREAAMVSREAGAYQGGLNFLSPLIEFWPTAPVIAIIAVGLNEKLQNLEETERWANVLVNSQPRDSVLGELFLVEVYGQQGNLEALKGVYNKLSGLPASFFIAGPLILDTIIALSVVLGDEAQTPLVYQQYIDLFPTTVKVETVMAAYYYKLEQHGRSLPHMRKALDLDPGMADAVRFKKILEEYSGSPLDEYHSEL
jgi:tetratricopeptide (TPR) repeat protein